MRLAATLVSIFALCFLPVFAQSDTAEPVVCEGVQDFYDEVDVENAVLLYVSTALTARRITDRIQSIDDLRAFSDNLLTSEHPDCITQAVEWYSTGLTLISNALENVINGEDDGVIYNLAVQYIGQWRGYMAAYGVELIDNSTSPAFR